MLDEKDLHLRHSDGVRKQVNYLVATSLAAVAFTVHITNDEKLAYAHIGFGLAVLAWAVSAVLGLQLLNDLNMIDRLNIESHMIRRGASPGVRQEDADAADAFIVERIGEINILNRKRFSWQWRLLLLGGACFIGSHIIRMAQ